MFNPSRDQVRRFFFGVWAKHKNRQPMEGAETLALPILMQHPEYHAMLERPERYLDRDYPPEFGETNPFLHLSMHLSLAEQASIDQPPGIRERLDHLAARLGDRMQAEHAAMDCLAEMIWQAQRYGTAYDAALYLDCLDAKIGG
ncbi:MAG: DUF1841 family protein [Pseudomonadota bacterium]